MRTMADRVEKARRSWNAGDLAGYLSPYDPSIRLHGYGPAPFDEAAVTEFYKFVWAAFGSKGRTSPHLELLRNARGRRSLQLSDLR